MRVYGMNEGQWHRLDNISAIMCMANLFIYFMDNRDTAFNDFLRLFFLFWCLVQQENGPWNLLNTVIPIVGALILPIIKHVFLSKTRPEFHWKCATPQQSSPSTTHPPGICNAKARFDMQMRTKCQAFEAHAQHRRQDWLAPSHNAPRPFAAEISAPEWSCSSSQSSSSSGASTTVQTTFACTTLV
jgi:hypothetical protein